MNEANTTVKVWDPLVRIGHWLLVAAFFTAWFTEDGSVSSSAASR